MRERSFKSSRPFRGRSNNSNNSRKRFFGGKSKSVEATITNFVNKASENAERQKPQEEYVSNLKFSDLNINPQLKANILSKKFTSPTPIQDKGIPVIIEGRDFLGIANTGTGKTACFLIPLIEKCLKNNGEKVLILTPTRELAIQVNDELKSFAKSLHIHSSICIGGASLRDQMFSLKKNPQFVIGTPGRIKDLLERRCLNISKFTNIVLDEVDRMLDMGFRDEIKELLALMPEKRQSLFFSATISSEVDVLIKGYLKDPVRISVKSQETSANIDQDVIKVTNDGQKIESLHDLLIKEDFKKVLIFGRTKRGVESLSIKLKERGFKVGSIHGDKSQSKREKVLDLFKSNKIQSLVATDVAARGLDIADITHVINYDLPATYEDYVHRIGRTGRANKKGKALTFISGN